MALDQLTVLKLVTRRLDENAMPYMATGSIAAGHYAQPRMTRDIDLVIDIAPGDAGRFCEIFGDAFACDPDAVRSAIERRSLFNLIHTDAIVKVDFVVRKETPFRIEEFGRRQLTTIDGQRMWIVSPEDLVLSKLVWAKDTGSELQLRDVRSLIAAQATLDWGYINRWASELGVDRTVKELRA